MDRSEWQQMLDQNVQIFATLVVCFTTPMEGMDDSNFQIFFTELPPPAAGIVGILNCVLIVLIPYRYSEHYGIF